MKIINFALGWPKASVRGEELFINTLRDRCRVRNLSFLLINEDHLDRLISLVVKDKFKIKFFLDMASETYDSTNKFTRFVYALKDAGTKIVADPDDVKEAADKSITHYDLIKEKIPVPYTVIIRNWEPIRRLTGEEKENLGLPFIIKPALGYGQKGVQLVTKRQTLREIAKAREVSVGDNFLLQKFIEPANLGGQPAWFRVYNLFGEIIPCWWNPKTNVFRQLTLREMDIYKLLPLVRLTSEIARLTHIDWFSCEIAKEKKSKKFIVIDYVNDQCAIYPQSQHKDGVPDNLIVHLAERIVEKAWQYIINQDPLSYRAVWFPKMNIRDENI